jgi:ribosomal protein L11 methyltransferase
MNLSSPSTFCASLALDDEKTARQAADFLSENLDAGEAAIAAFESAPGHWGISLHFASAPDEARIRNLIQVIAGEQAAKAVAFSRIEARDWIKASLAGLAPVHAGRFIVHGRHDREKIASNRTGIEIEAALAFGTGHHATTRGCLVLLDDLLRWQSPCRILDLGAGTGVLAIAAAKALKIPVLATDIDRCSASVARDNARLNGAGALVESICATGFAAPHFGARGPFDLVMANILAAPLKRLAGPMAQHLAPGAHVILSGLLQPQALGVISAYRAYGLVLMRKITIDGWSSLLLVRPR